MGFEVIQGDCLDVMRGLPAAFVDLVLTDPPFSSGTRREAAKGIRKSMNRETEAAEWFGSDSLTTNGFAYLLRQCALEWHRLLKEGGHALVFIDWRMMPTLAAAIESADLRHNGLLVWDKTYFGMGSFFRNQHELILHFSKGKGREPLRRDCGNVLHCPPIRDGEHPTEKPTKLIGDLLSVLTAEGDVVLDCFAGSGTTGAACAAHWRNFIGIEREPEYVAIARRRIEEGLKRALLFDAPKANGTAASTTAPLFVEPENADSPIPSRAVTESNYSTRAGVVQA